MATAVLIGTLDTKGTEYGYVRDELVRHGLDVIVIDVGVMQAAIPCDISRFDVADAVGISIDELVERGDRGEAIAAMAEAATVLVAGLHQRGEFDGILGLGGTGGTALISQVMRSLPIGMPKLIVSTVASGQTRQYVGATDITMMYSVTDIAGINSISTMVLTNAAGALTGMITSTPPERSQHRPLIGATMFGVTTPCVTRARQRLEDLGYDVLVFHATGTGGASMEALVRDGLLAGVLDITTTELADDLVGGIFSAGPDRLLAAALTGIPQIVSLGALDMVNFGPEDTVPEVFRSRLLYRHNPSVTLMRTTEAECAELGRRIGEKLSRATGPTAVFVPLGGVSAIDVPGGPFFDPSADAALFSAVRSSLAEHVQLREYPVSINDESFALAMADALDELIRDRKACTTS